MKRILEFVACIYILIECNNRWMDASELETLLTEFAEKLMANQPKTRETLFREYMQATAAERRKFDLSFLGETRKEALAILTDLGYECKLPVEPASEGLEQASKEWLRPQLDKSYADYGERKMMELTHFDGYAMLDAIEFGTQWQKEQMMKDAVIIEDELVMCYNNGEPMGLSPYKEWWETPEVQTHFKDGDKVKVIIVKDND